MVTRSDYIKYKIKMKNLGKRFVSWEEYQEFYAKRFGKAIGRP